MQAGSIWRIKGLYIAPRPTLKGADTYFSEEKTQPDKRPIHKNI